jgi:hypothetical protein
MIIARGLLILFFLTPVTACAQPAAPPPARQLTPDQQRIASAGDLAVANVEFDQTGAGPLAWLVPDAPAMADISGGWLTVRAKDPMPGWYSDGSGPFLYTSITGDFMIETRVTANKRGATDLLPTAKFTSSGLLIRDPASTTKKMRWVMYNIGYQDKFFGTEAKTTRDYDGKFHFHNLGGFRSLSTLYLTERPGPSTEAQLRMCRIGAEFRMFWRRSADSAWAEESQDNTTQVQGNGASNPSPGVVANGPIRMIRPDLPTTVQAGIIANRGGSSDKNADGESRFDYVRYRRIKTFDACTR